MKKFTMKNTIKVLGIIALIALIGFSMAGCKNDDDGGDPNPQTGGGRLPAPTLSVSPSGTVTAGTTIYLNWTSIAGASGYNFYANVILGSNSSGWISDRTTSTSDYLNTAEYAGYTLQFKVAAYSANGTEGWESNVVSVTITGGTTQPQPNTSLDGVWELSTGSRITVNGSTGVFSAFSSSPSALTQSAINQGYIKIGDQAWRNITSTGNLTWSGQDKHITATTSKPTVATGTTWTNATFTMSANGQTLTLRGSDTNGAFTSTYTRR
jgi:hypothetical protein